MFYNVKITDLLSVERLAPTHLFLIANPIVGDDSLIDEDTPYTSNKISGKELSNSICEGVLNAVTHNDFNLHGTWTFPLSDHIPTIDTKIDPTEFVKELENQKHLYSVADDNDWYASLSSSVLSGNALNVLSTTNNTIANIGFVERIIAQTYRNAAKLVTTKPIPAGASIRFGTGHEISVRNRYTDVGVWGSNVLQAFLIDNEFGWYHALSATEIPSWCQNGSIEKTFLELLDEKGIPAGSVFSDGIYYYYRVLNDSIVSIQLFEDYTNIAGEAIIAYILLGTKLKVSETRINQIGYVIESTSGAGNVSYITIPMKKNTVLMFGTYLMQRLGATGAFGWQNYSCAPRINGAGGGIVVLDYLSNLYKKNSPYSINKANCESGYTQLELSTFRINADGSNLSTVFWEQNSGIDARHYYLYNANRSFGTVATITELL